MYDVIYMKPKKKGFSTQTATFMKIEDCIWWEKIKTKEGCKNFKILVK